MCVCVCIEAQAAHNELKTSNHRFLINIAARRSRFNYISSKNTMRKQNPIVDVYR